ncbi:MAG: hypothetical protein LBQ62_03495 [Candidatus Accumulibacter sp.]|jgi:hypothetical protein|nr:hypothetical protein [Accumulibacter sp.]
MGNTQQGAVSFKNILILCVVLAVAGHFLPILLGGNAAVREEANFYGQEMNSATSDIAQALRTGDRKNVVELSRRIETAKNNIDQRKKVKLPRFRALALEGLSIDDEATLSLMRGESGTALEKYMANKRLWLKKLCAYFDAPEKGLSVKDSEALEIAEACSKI